MYVCLQRGPNKAFRLVSYIRQPWKLDTLLQQVRHTCLPRRDMPFAIVSLGFNIANHMFGMARSNVLGQVHGFISRVRTQTFGLQYQLEAALH